MTAEQTETMYITVNFFSGTDDASAIVAELPVGSTVLDLKQWLVNSTVSPYHNHATTDFEITDYPVPNLPTALHDDNLLPANGEYEGIMQ